MKRIFAVILCMAMCLGVLTACGADNKSGGDLQIGFGKSDVTPTTSIQLDGYQGTQAAEFRWSTGSSWPFHALCVAFTDAKNNTVMLLTLDMLNAFMADAMRDAISGETGIPKSNIMFHCTHNHSGPAIRTGTPEASQYLTQLTNGVLSAAKMALDDRKPIKSMQTTYARPDGCNTERHYLLADGSYQSYNVGSVPQNEIIGHYGVADNLLQLIKFTREGGKDVVLVNWQGHPPGGETLYTATSNYPGVLRNYLDTNLNCDSVFLLGGSGNLNNTSQIAGEVRHSDYQELGKNLGAAAVEAAANFTERKIDNISILERELVLDSREGGVYKVWMYAIALGDFALVTAPFEIFDDNAVAVRESSPYAMTMYVSCCNGSNGYLPTPPSYDWKITYESRTTSFPKGTAEIVESNLIEMLGQIASESGYETVEKAADYYQGEFEPKTDGVTYQIMTTSYKAVENNFFAFQVFQGNVVKNMLCNDEALTKEILSKTQVKLLFNEQHVIVGIVE